MSVHHFDSEIAEEVGVNAAVLAYNVHFWCKHKAANGKDIIDGKPWIYNSAKAWADLIPYLSEKQIRTALGKLEAAGIIESGNHSPSAYDQTKWYSYTRHDWSEPVEGNTNYPKGKMEKTAKADVNLPNGQMSSAQKGKSYKEPNKPIENLYALDPAGAGAVDRLRLQGANEAERQEVEKLIMCLCGADASALYLTSLAMVDRFSSSLSKPLRAANLKLAVQDKRPAETNVTHLSTVGK